MERWRACSLIITHQIKHHKQPTNKQEQTDYNHTILHLKPITRQASPIKSKARARVRAGTGQGHARSRKVTQGHARAVEEKTAGQCASFLLFSVSACVPFSVSALLCFCSSCSSAPYLTIDSTHFSDIFTN